MNNSSDDLPACIQENFIVSPPNRKGLVEISRDAVELVAGFGKDEKLEPERPLQPGTVTGTGTAENEEVRHDA